MPISENKSILVFCPGVGEEGLFKVSMILVLLLVLVKMSETWVSTAI